MRRLRFKHLAVVAGVLGTLALLAGVGFLADRYAGRRDDVRRLNEALARLDADDPDWHVVGVVKAHNAAIPDDDAANVTKVTLNALGWRPPSAKSRQLAISAQEIPDLVWDDERLPHDDEFCSLYEVHLDSAQAHREAFAARQFPTGGMPLHFREPDPFNTLLTDVQKVREGYGLFSDYATAEAYLGRGDEALRAADACLHFAQASLATEPCLISQLVRYAGCAIAVGTAQKTLAWSEPAGGLAELQAAFAQAATVDGITPAIRGERAAVLRIYDNVRSGALPLDTLINPSGRTVSSWADRMELRYKARNIVRDQAESVRFLGELLVAAKSDGPARRAACHEIEVGIRLEVGRVVPSVLRCVEADDRSRARMLCASVGLACERHRRQFGHFPKTLADIPTAILPAIPTDPFSGKPLLYKLQLEGAVVYTVGPNGTYQADPDHEDGLELRLRQQSEFRLWNPDARRRPPLPRFDPNAEDVPELPEVP